MSSPAHQVLSSAYTRVCNSNYKASQWFTCAGETLTKQEKTGYKEWNVADQKLCQSLPSLLLSSLLQVLPAGKESKNSFGTCSEKKLIIPRGKFISLGDSCSSFASSQTPSGRGCRECYPSPHNSLWLAASGVGTRTCTPAWS